MTLMDKLQPNYHNLYLLLKMNSLQHITKQSLHTDIRSVAIELLMAEVK